MPRRVSLPAADDLFRPTVVPDPEQAAPSPAPTAPEPTPAEPGPPTKKDGRAPSGRVRHDEKMTVYVTADELLDLEHARLTLRRHHGLGVDRGRLVREAVAMALEDLEEHGDASQIVRRLRQG